MIIYTKISDFFKIDKVQRIIYVIALILYLLALYDNFYLYDSTTSFGIKYYYFFLIPKTLLILQIIFNKFIFWFCIFGLVFSYTLVTFYSIIQYFRFQAFDVVKGIGWDFEQILILLLFFCFIFTVNFILYSIKPNKLKS